MAEMKQFCTFQVASNCLGVDIVRVQEVLRNQVMTRVPLAPDVIGGLINLRGEIVTAVDIRRLFEIEDDFASQQQETVVIKAGQGTISLMVDEIGDVVEVSDESFESAPETVGGVARELVQGVFKLEDRLMLVLDTEKVMEFAQVITERKRISRERGESIRSASEA